MGSVGRYGLNIGNDNICMEHFLQGHPGPNGDLGPPGIPGAPGRRVSEHLSMCKKHFSFHTLGHMQEH